VFLYTEFLTIGILPKVPRMNGSKMPDAVKPFLAEEPAALVDEALAETDRNPENTELHALRVDVAQLQDALRNMASDARRVASGELRSRIRRQPFAAALTVGFLGFVYGLTR
jgi:hypothetical protein